MCVCVCVCAHEIRLMDRVDMVPRGLEPRTLRLLAVRSNQLNYETCEASCLHFSYVLLLSCEE